MRKSICSVYRHHTRKTIGSHSGCSHVQTRYLAIYPTQRQKHTNQSSTPWKPQLVVFDQYGTLVNIHSVWEPWVERISHKLESATGLQLHQKVYKCLDICNFTKKVRHGLLGEGNTWQIKQGLVQLLYSEGLSSRDAHQLVENNWENCSSPAQHLYETKAIFEDMKAAGTKIALCSSDDRSSIMETLKNSDLIGLVDHVTCGDDFNVTENSRVSAICEELGISADDTVVIGDAVGDIVMGREANVALTVGVLSGIGTRLNLTGIADIVTKDLHEAISYMKTLDRSQMAHISRNRSTTTDKKNQASLVIFDKDGTLLCFHSLWTPWAAEMIDRLECSTGLKLADKVLHELGYSMTQQKWRPAVFTEGTTKQSIDKVADILEQEGMDRSRAISAIQNAWIHSDHSGSNSALKVFDHPASIFKTLKSLGIKVAVCTSDNRRGTEEFLNHLNALSYVDMIVCGDDPDSIPKPDAHNALRICDVLGVTPETAVMVGDTSADMEMGRAAKLGATVAVLTGVGDVDHLAPDADHMVPSISHVLDVVTSHKQRQYAKDLYRKELEINISA